MSDINQTGTTFRTPSHELIPRWMIRAVVTLLLMVLALVSFARLTDRPLVAVPAQTPVEAERLVILSVTPGGETTILEADGSLIETLPAHKAGFISGMTRVIDRERVKHNIDPATPIAIQQRGGGRLTLFDPATGWSAELASYGENNTSAFARLLETSSTVEGSQ